MKEGGLNGVDFGTDTVGAPILPAVTVKLDDEDCASINVILAEREEANDLLADIFEQVNKIRAKTRQKEREWWTVVFKKYDLNAKAPEHHWGYDENAKQLTAIKPRTNIEEAAAALKHANS